MMLGIRGFSLVELVVVMVLISILATTAFSKFSGNETFELQASRDRLVAAFFVAQQKAMSQANAIRLTTSGATIDIRQDQNNNGTFEASESIRWGANQYPVVLDHQSLTAGSFTYDRLGYTSADNVTLSQGGKSVAVTITASGYAY